jgi:hypothetical protein
MTLSNASSDDQPASDRPGFAIAVHNPTEIWHLSSIVACRKLLDVVEDPNVRGALLAAAETSWQAYVATTARTVGQREALIRAGQPAHIGLDDKEGFPVVTWNDNNPALSDAWGFLQIRPTNSPTTPSLALSTPFRQVELSKLPAGTRCFALHDPRHTATAAVDELVGLVLRDLKRASEQHQGEDAWRALRSHASFLVAAARASLERLPDDDFRDWQRPTLPSCAIEQASERVAALALTTRAQQALALHFVARGYANVQDEVGDLDESFAARVAEVARRMETLSKLQQTTLDAFNQSVLAKSKVPYVGVVPTVIFRPIPFGVPVLAAIPEETMTLSQIPRTEKPE